ncbi:molybdopterin-synthase adenylyltransferase MoeB [Prochlorococcus sp. MIT 1300]|uniref:molybdopterin-synthase adenylyltransferase MoeB n=1 Tax=Prochlorococcus sp. MIT 1300 TaxID=3096218 RepID=UPI002A74938D|nr:molybdopterin-synthase adenylyltransferase MoeB [Prochlorococcus sp. MIT 1300]
MAHDIADETSLSNKELLRYARHLSLAEIGIEGQKKLKASSVLCVGSGGLGSPLLLYLASAGVGKIGIVDFDIVEESNLQRQIIHSTEWIGENKTASAKARLLEINPFCQINLYNEKISPTNALEIIKPYDIVCDCTDNFPSRYLLNDACVILEKPNVYGSVQQFEGQVSVFNLTKNSPNYRDLLPVPPPEELIPSCAQAGVIGVVPGLIGVIQASEVIKIITEIGSILNGRLLVFNALNMHFRELKLKKNPNSAKITNLIDYKKFCQSKDTSKDLEITNQIETISAGKLKIMMSENPDSIILIDVRMPHENQISSIKGAKLYPLSQIENGELVEEIKAMAKGRKLFIHCKSGHRSLKAIRELSRHGIKGINVIGGIDAWNAETNNPHPA